MSDFARQVLEALRAREPELRQAGVRRLSIFGSVARGDEEAESDVDLAAELRPDLDMVDVAALERVLGEALGRTVGIIAEPVDSPRLRANIERDRVVAF